MSYMESLVEKYFEGATLQEEETLLQNYFRSEQVAESHKRYIPLFVYIEDAKKHHDRQVAIFSAKKGYRKWLYMVSGVAATALLFLGIYRYGDTGTSSAKSTGFVCINGIYSDDPDQVRYYAAQAVDHFIMAQTMGLEDTRNVMYQIYKAIDDCITPFEPMIFNKNIN